MGKETKIGLAVIGVLVAVFGVMLFRHLSIGKSATKWDSEIREPARGVATADASAARQPNVVAAQPETTAGDSGALWPAPAGGAAAVPAASYMPDDAESNAAEDRYAAGARANQTPFADHDAPAGEAESDAGAAASDTALAAPAELPRDDAGANVRRNPLRRLSAELPLDAPQQPGQAEANAEPGAELGDPAGAAEPAIPGRPGAGDPYADEPAAPAPQPAEIPDASAAEPLRMPSEPTEAAPPAESGADEPGAIRPAAPADADAWRAGEGATPPVARERVSVENGLYTVQPNDTLWSISEKVYGTGGYFKALAAHNRARLRRSDQLTVGTEIAVPPAGELQQAYPSLCPKERRSALVAPRSAAAAPRRASGADAYIVEEGDTLFDIARYELGKASRWAEIYELNRDKLGEDFDYLQPGLELVMPPRGADTEAIGRGRGGNAFR